MCENLKDVFEHGIVGRKNDDWDNDVSFPST